MSFKNCRIFHGSANIHLAKKVAVSLGVKLGASCVSRFSDGEVRIEVLENVRGCEVFIIQSTCTPSNDNLMELILMGDALRRASVENITAVIPYFGYARQDRRVRSTRVPISAKVVADMLQSVGFSRVVTVELHADAIQGFFYIPVDNVYASGCMIAEDDSMSLNRFPVIVSPDVGGVVRARAIAKSIGNADLAMIDKRRSEPNKVDEMNVIGDVAGRCCVIVDDIVDTAGTLCHAAIALKEKGASSVIAYCVHPVLSGHAVDRINKSCIDKLVVTDTIELNAVAKQSDKIVQVSLSKLLSTTIHKIHNNESVSEMFAD